MTIRASAGLYSLDRTTVLSWLTACTCTDRVGPGGPGPPSAAPARPILTRFLGQIPVPTRPTEIKPVSDGVGALFTYTRHYRRDPARQVPPLGVGDPLPKVSRDTCSGTASIWPLRGYTRHWDGKRGDNAAFRSDISAWLCHNRLANPLGCLLYGVQLAPSIGIRAPFELGRRLRQSPT